MSLLSIPPAEHGDAASHPLCDLCDAVGHHPGSGCGCGAPELERVDTVWTMCGECALEDARLSALAALYDSLGALDCKKAAAR